MTCYECVCAVIVESTINLMADTFRIDVYAYKIIILKLLINCYGNSYITALEIRYSTL
ncbi:MAG: hypothetical protein MRZ77_06075 [Clostridiales bacterium]|nr:hypothetical protein [Clostridiales bacterium]